MPHSAYPSSADLQQFLVGNGLTLPTSFAYDAHASAIRSEWEKLTGRIPFLGDAVDVTFLYDPPGAESRNIWTPYVGGQARLDLWPGWVSITSIALGVTVDNPVGSIVDLSRQIRFYPQNQSLRGIPIEWVDFKFPVWGVAGSVQVIGKRGYSATIPDEAWLGMLYLGGSNALMSYRASLLSGALSWKEADVTESRDPKAIMTLGDDYKARAMQIIAQYKQIYF